MAMERNGTPNGKRITYRKFILSSLDSNANKYWNIGLYDSDDVEIEFGRVGVTSTKGVHRSGGQSKLEELIQEKTSSSHHGGAYQELKTIDVINDKPSISSYSNSTKKISNSTLQDIAVKQIEHDSPEVAKLIRWLADVNKHNIITATGGNITYDDNSGLFRTPLGIVTPDVVSEARDYLTTIGDYVSDYEKQGWPTRFDNKFENAIEQYLMRIPSNVGMKLNVKTFVPDLRAVQAQNQILDALDASYKQAITTTPKDKKQDTKTEQKVFNVKLYILEDKKEWDRIHRFYKNTKNDVHTSCNLKLNKIFIVDIAFMKDIFDKVGRTIGNIMELWHGTKSSNCLSILSGGLQIPPANSSHITGRLYGDGAYTSPSSTKALNYATSFWGGRDEGRYFMFICDTAMGKYYVPKSQKWGYVNEKFPAKGYDSTWAKGGISGVHNDECIVYKVSQINLKYLVEFGK